MLKSTVTLGRVVSHSPSVFSSSTSPLSSITRRGGQVVDSRRSVQINATDKSSRKSLDNSPNLMEASFGEGYATRSEEEGFGEIYGGKCSGECETESMPRSCPYRHQQGSEVKEKEKARNRPRAD